jgi:hypothetical protein
MVPTRRPVLFLWFLFVFLCPALEAQPRPGRPMRIVLLVDSSSAVASMLTPFRMSLTEFLDALPGEPEIVFVTSGGQMRIRVPPTTDRTKLRAAASAFASDGGGNAFVDALLEADQRFLRGLSDRNSIIVILTTDRGGSVDDARIDNYNKFADEFVGRGGRAHAIVVRSLAAGTTLRIAENLAHNTGGYFETVTIPTAVPRLMKVMADYVAADQ